MDLKQMDLNQRWRSLIAHQRQLILAVILGVPIIIISAALIINSLPTSFTHYQTHQAAIHALRSLEGQFNQEVLKSRYELFTSYDPIVQNIAKQKALQHQLEQTIPNFLGPREQQNSLRILAERRTALQQKEDLSELFKTQNAQLKNSLRYLPFLTERLEASFSATALITPVSASSTPPQPDPSSQRQSSNRQSIEAAPEFDEPAVPTRPIGPSAFVTRPETTPMILPEALIQLKDSLNQLIRNVLLYNISAEEELAAKTEAIVQQLTDLKNTLELDSDLIPIDLFRRHAQIILTTKRYVEDYTTQLLLPFNQYTDNLESMLEQAYQQANSRANQYRLFSMAWIFALLMLGNAIVLQRIRHTDPAFSHYQQQVKYLTDVAIKLQHIQSTLSFPLQTHKHQQHLDQPPENDFCAILIHQQQALTSFSQQQDELGELAHSLQQWNKSIQQHYEMEQEESFSFLTARLSVLTQNRRRLMNHQVCAAVQVTIEQVLAAYQCDPLDVQFELDQMSILFSYPTTIQLASLIKTIKTQTAVDLYPTVGALDSTILKPEDIWIGAYLIASCDPPNQPSQATFVDQASHSVSSPSVHRISPEALPFDHPQNPQRSIQSSSSPSTPSGSTTTIQPVSSQSGPPTTIQPVPSQPSSPTTIQSMPSQIDEPGKS